MYRSKADGKWIVAITLPNGKRVTRYRATKAEALAALAALRGETPTLVSPQPPRTPDRLTLGAWTQQWLGLREPDIRPSTLRTYQKA